MTDRELLELAAKAAGYDVTIKEVGGCLVGERTVGSLGFIFWRPLLDDGDALRLAVALDMSVEVSAHEQSTYAYAGDVPRKWAMENWQDDKHAATRRAIVRAAAEIGKGMK